MVSVPYDSSSSSTLTISLPPPIKQSPRVILTAPTDDASISSVLNSSQQLETLNQGLLNNGDATTIQTPVTPTPNKGMYIAAATVLVILLFSLKK